MFQDSQSEPTAGCPDRFIQLAQLREGSLQTKALQRVLALELLRSAAIRAAA